MEEKTPLIVQAKMKQLGLNTVTAIDVPKRKVYELSAVDDNGIDEPTGLPKLVEIVGNRLVDIEYNEAFEILERYGRI